MLMLMDMKHLKKIEENLKFFEKYQYSSSSSTNDIIKNMFI